MMGLVKYLSLLLFMTGLFSCGVQAIELSAQVKHRQLAVKLTGIDYPQQFTAKELDSGLPNTVTLYLTLNANSELIYGLTVNYQIVYDLWDEVYVLDRMASDGQQQRLRFKTKAKLLKYLAGFEQSEFYLMDNLVNKGNLMLSAQAIVNPVETERIKKIQAWIANSKGFDAKVGDKHIQTVSNSPTGSVAARAATGSGPRFQKLFDNILAQYISSDELPALWRSNKVTIELNLTNRN